MGRGIGSTGLGQQFTRFADVDLSIGKHFTVTGTFSQAVRASHPGALPNLFGAVGMANWNDLPVELALLILGYMDTEALAVMCQVSTCSTTIARAFLYNSITVDCAAPLSLVHSKLYRLVRTLSKRPELGSLVRKLTLGVFREPRKTGPYGSQKLDHRAWNILYQSTYAVVLDPELDEDIKDILDDQKELGCRPPNLGIHSLLRQVLLHLGQLNGLTVLHGDPKTCWLLLDVALKFTEGKKAFQKVTSLDCAFEGKGKNDYWHSLDTVLAFCLIPSLKHWRLWRAGNYGPEEQRDDDCGVYVSKDKQIKPHSIPLLHLLLESSSITCASMRRLLALPQKLRSFTYIFKHLTPVDLTALSEALLQQAFSLETIEIRAEDGTPPHVFGSMPNGFRDFPVLRELKVDVRTLTSNKEGPNTKALPLSTLVPFTLAILEVYLRPSMSLWDFVSKIQFPEDRSLKKSLPSLERITLHVKEAVSNAAIGESNGPARPSPELLWEELRAGGILVES